MFTINGIPIRIDRYPDGTQRLNISANSDKIVLEWLYERDEEMTLLFLARHIRENSSVKNLILSMPYIPHARMDRIKDKSEVFTLKYFCEFINSLYFDQVIVRDAHSSVSLALLNNVVPESIDQAIIKLISSLLDPQKDILFYPDEGSCKRYVNSIEFPYAFGIKKRDWETGRITSFDILGKIPTEPFNALIIDDISSYGGTFIHAAKKLKESGAQNIYLYVTHCENSILKGELINAGLLRKIYTTKSIYTADHPLIEVIR